MHFAAQLSLGVCLEAAKGTYAARLISQLEVPERAKLCAICGVFFKEVVVAALSVPINISVSNLTLLHPQQLLTEGFFHS